MHRGRHDELTACAASPSPLRTACATELRERWDRDLPLDELLFDRWERARELGFGEGTSIYHSSYVYGDVRVGRGTWIGPFTMLDGTGGLRSGTLQISSGVQIYTHDTVEWAVSGGDAPYERAPVESGAAATSARTRSSRKGSRSATTASSAPARS